MRIKWDYDSHETSVNESGRKIPGFTIKLSDCIVDCCLETHIDVDFNLVDLDIEEVFDEQGMNQEESDERYQNITVSEACKAYGESSYSTGDEEYWLEEFHLWIESCALRVRISDLKHSDKYEYFEFDEANIKLDPDRLLLSKVYDVVEEEFKIYVENMFKEVNENKTKDEFLKICEKYFSLYEQYQLFSDASGVWHCK